MNNFDLFRLNCFLNDTQAIDFKNIVVSLVSEFIFDNNNEESTLESCYLHIIDFHKLEIEKDFFQNTILNSNNFDKKSLHDSIIIKLTPEKFNKIHHDINEHNIDKYIKLFLTDKSYDQSLSEPIRSLIFKAVYDNIHTFSTDNLNSLISENLTEEFTSEQIQAFNSFLDYNNYEKNTALYNIFLKATEFAIITSGKGVKNLSKDIFRGKRYCLDTNIILRLLGIGGEERKETLKKLIKSCNHQGITFEYTGQTFQELKRTLSSNVKYLKFAESKYDIDKLGKLSESDPQLISEDFISHYSKEKLARNVNNPDQYEIEMLRKLRSLESELSFGVTKGSVHINEKLKAELSKFLHKQRKELPYGKNYTKTAADIDSYNILFVRNLRAGNNYNYIDVKSFYLTTDRTLNDILSKEDSSIIIPETILPSQLFILHHPYMSNGEEVDYDLFLQFVKRRSTEYNFKGGEVLTYINEIRKKTTSDEELINILHIYADKRYEYTKGNNENGVRHIVPIKEIIETVIDKKLAEGQKATDDLETIKNNAQLDIKRLHRNSRNLVRFIDVLLTLLIIPTSILSLKTFTTNFTYLIIGTIFFESIKFLITSKTRTWNILWSKILKYMLINSNYYKLTKDVNYLNDGFINYNNVDGEIWKRSK